MNTDVALPRLSGAHPHSVPTALGGVGRPAVRSHPGAGRRRPCAVPPRAADAVATEAAAPAAVAVASRAGRALARRPGAASMPAGC